MQHKMTYVQDDRQLDTFYYNNKRFYKTRISRAHLKMLYNTNRNVQHLVLRHSGNGNLPGLHLTILNSMSHR